MVTFCGPGLARYAEINEATVRTSVFLAQARDDAVIPVADREALREERGQRGMAVKWYCYEDGGHWVNEPRGVDDVVAVLQKASRERPISS